MRLNQIKLSGFKSFLETTKFSFDTLLTGIVGPNGCGKSNIIDAIRWVIGESSAKQLRGENLADVIFGGSLNQKPVGKAQVELVFDNHQKQLSGRFAEYDEISIKREITREEGSTYFLNQSICRRRDIVDILLGTGLGPRSYAVIEQDMITKLISATPEELRSYLEEAAKVSKYKERRKEAEIRISKTKENIIRINDLESEVNVNLEKMSAQAETAECYQNLKKELQMIEGQIEVLEINVLQKKIQQIQSNIQEKEQILSHCTQKKAVHEQEKMRLIHNSQEYKEALEKVQDEHHQINIEISRLEQVLKDRKHQHQTFKESSKQFEINQSRLLGEYEKDQKELDDVNKKNAQNEPFLPLKVQARDRCQAGLLEAQLKWKNFQNQLELLNKKTMKSRQSIELNKNQLQQLHRLKENIQQSQARLVKEENQLKIDRQDQPLMQWARDLEYLSLEIYQSQLQLQDLEEAIQFKKKTYQESESLVHQTKSLLQKLEAEQASLKALQKLALGNGKQYEDFSISLKAKNQSIEYFANHIKISPEWEIALETVLKDFLDGLCIENLQDIAQNFPLHKGVCLVEVKDEWNSMVMPSGTRELGKNTPCRKLMYQMICFPSGLINLIADIYIAEHLQEALEQMKALKAHESIITKEGVWVGHTWLRIPQVKTEQSGMLARQNRLTILMKEIQKEEQILSSHENQKDMIWFQLIALKKEKEIISKSLHDKKNQKIQIEANVNAKKLYIDQVKLRENQVIEEQKKLDQKSVQYEIEFAEIQQKLRLLTQEVDEQNLGEQQLQVQKRELNQIFEQSKRDAKQAEHELSTLTSEIDLSGKQIQYLEQQIFRTTQQLAVVDQQSKLVYSQLLEIEAVLPQLESQYRFLQQQQAEKQSQLAKMKSHIQTMEQSLHTLKKEQQQKIAEIDQVKQSLESLRIDHETTKVQLQHREEKLRQIGLESQKLIATLSKDARKTVYLAKQKQLHLAIQNLGPINLTAPMEYEELLKRKNYLSDQVIDLTEGLKTLEAAIIKIDQETCTQLQQTFEQINHSFKILFSKIFEGGQASLELTEKNWLSTGIIVQAQPMGKRNATIHLLSGGEKALTAIALVFAFFQLNPAPFCILDEVDAPLDDHNIERFCKLVKEMSQTLNLQFIFISHSKVTLTMAKQLIGVTMREPGVSRIVSVNIEEAMSWLPEEST